MKIAHHEDRGLIAHQVGHDEIARAEPGPCLLDRPALHWHGRFEEVTANMPAAISAVLAISRPRRSCCLSRLSSPLEKPPVHLTNAAGPRKHGK
jgi:hypothetical protein